MEEISSQEAEQLTKPAFYGIQRCITYPQEPATEPCP